MNEIDSVNSQLNCVRKSLSGPLVLGGAATTTVSALAAKSIITIGISANFLPIIGIIAGIAMMILGTYFIWRSWKDSILNNSPVEKNISQIALPNPPLLRKVSPHITDSSFKRPPRHQIKIENTDLKSDSKAFFPSKPYANELYLKSPNLPDANILDQSTKINASEPSPLDLSYSDKLQTGSNLLQWALIGAGALGAPASILFPVSALAGLGSEIAVFCSLPKDASWLRKAMSIPVLSRLLINYNPWIAKISQALSFFNLAGNSISKIHSAWERFEKEPSKAIKSGAVHLFNLASGTAFAAETAGLINLKPNDKFIDESKEQKDLKNQKVNRKIKLATVFHNEGSEKAERDKMSKFSIDNHRRYAEKWGLGHDIVSDSLVGGKCKIDDQTTDCSPYFNKLEYLRQQCLQHSPLKNEESWVIYGDDDLIYTNPNINPWHAIDQLREGKDTSVIMAREGADWIPAYPLPGDKYKIHDPRIAVNSGFIIARMDPKGCNFIKKVWEHRNDPTDKNSWNYPNCKTVGTCKNLKTILNDQTAVAMALQDDLSAIDRDVTVILPRDPQSPTRANIAFNTLHRDGCFAKISKGSSGQEKVDFIHDIGEFDAKHYKDGQWRPGDWNGQPAGMPTKARYPLRRDQNGKCLDDPNLPTVNAKLEKMREMADKIPKELRFTLGATFTTDKSHPEARFDHLTIPNHQEYAKINKADFRLMTDPINMECKVPHRKEPVQCAAYWRKIYEIKHFLDQPQTPGVEDWYVYADEDGIYGNMNLSLSQLLQDLRGDDKIASILVAKDVEQAASLTNTGLIFVRRDEKSREFINKWLEMRDAPTHNPTPKCPTLGGCQTQRGSLHEQEALNRLLQKSASANKVVKVVEIRPYGINSFFRDGCFDRLAEGTYDRLDFRKDAWENPAGVARPGDFFYQTAGVPRMGKYCSEPSDMPPHPIRVNYISKMLENVKLAKFNPIFKTN